MRAGGLEVAMAGTLLGSFLTIPAYWAHLTFGVAFVLLASVHIGRRRRGYLAVLRRRRRQAVVSTVLVASAVIMAVSGIVQWAGVVAAIPWHGASSMLLILLGAGHAIRRVRRGRLADFRVGTAHIQLSDADGTGYAAVRAAVCRVSGRVRQTQQAAGERWRRCR